MISLIYIHTQEWLRLKFLQVAFFLAFAYICISYLLGSLSFTEQLRIKYDLGLAGLEITTFLVSAFIANHALHRDIDRKTFQVILARPIARWHLLVGYLGSLALLNLILVLLLGTTMVLFFGAEINLISFLIILFTILLKSVLIGSFGIMLSTLVRPMFGLVMTVAYWVLAYSVSDIIYFINKIDHQLAEFILKMFHIFIPQFYLFNWKSYIYLKNSFILTEVIWSWFHCLGWTMLLLFISSLIIRKKDII